MRVVDLRSDTITKPSVQMREFISRADVGDDVFGEDPTVNRLQDLIVELTAKEAALFVTSGTQANQVAINSHTSPGDEVICEYYSHIFNLESGAPGMLSGIQLHPLKGIQGILDTHEVQAAIRPANHHYPKTRLICIENTNNRWGGTIYPLKEIEKIRKIADENNLSVHLDGARLWNAAIATGNSISRYAELVDSLSLCFSKGLGAPVGSVITGSAAFIERAHYYRKSYGGGLRQSGLLAAGALYAIENNLPKLEMDHSRAKKIAKIFDNLNGFNANPAEVETNIIIIETRDTESNAHQVSKRLKENGILVLPISMNQLRAVTHLDICDDDVQYVECVLSKIYSNKTIQAE